MIFFTETKKGTVTQTFNVRESSLFSISRSTSASRSSLVGRWFKRADNGIHLNIVWVNNISCKLFYVRLNTSDLEFVKSFTPVRLKFFPILPEKNALIATFLANN